MKIGIASIDTLSNIRGANTGVHLHERLRRIVQEEMYAPKATAGPRYSKPNIRLKIWTRIIVSTGTSSLRWIRPNLLEI
jgi:hypothetical protein